MAVSMHSAVLTRTVVITDLMSRYAERYILDNHLFNLAENRWAECPDLTQWHQNLESDFCVFFNKVALGCGQALSAGLPIRYWTAKYSTTVLTGHEAQRKPDLTLIDQGTAADWRCVRSVGEMKSKRFTSSGFAEILNQISGMKSSIVIVEVLGLRWVRSQVFHYLCFSGQSKLHSHSWIH
jgi:hypothetical protein